MRSSIDTSSKTDDAGNGEYEKEVIVLLEKGRWIFAMMIGMKRPEEAVHDVLVGKPCHTFHTKESDEKHDNIDVPHSANVYEQIILRVYGSGN